MSAAVAISLEMSSRRSVLEFGPKTGQIAAIAAKGPGRSAHENTGDLAYPGDLQPRLAMLGELAASVAHEITQPLATIMTSAQAGLRWLNRSEPDLDEVRATLQAIVQDGTRAAEAVQSIRTLARSAAHNLEQVDPAGVAMEALAILRPEFQAQGVAVFTSFDLRGRQVLANRVQLRQIFSNLIRNSLEALDSCDGERVIELWGVLEGERVCLGVRDTGSGLPAGAGGQIFDPLFTTKVSGMGMGLAICRSIAASHDGYLRASRAVPRGTEFVLILPAGPRLASVSPLRREEA